jgi:hypothetical protein
MDVTTEDRLDADPMASGDPKPNRFSLRATLGAGTATLANLATYSAAVHGGVSFRLRDQAHVFETFQGLTTGFRLVHPYNVAIDTAIPFLLGALLFSFAARRSRSAAIGVLILAAGAAVLVLVELQHVARMTTSALVMLSLMDLIAGAIFAGALVPALPTPRPASDRRPRAHPDRSPLA